MSITNSELADLGDPLIIEKALEDLPIGTRLSLTYKRGYMYATQWLLNMVFQGRLSTKESYGEISSRALRGKWGKVEERTFEVSTTDKFNAHDFASKTAGALEDLKISLLQ